jgi:hypothetical protein
VTTITENTNAGTGVLDPLGASIDDGPELYFTLIRNMAKSLKDWLLKTSYKYMREFLLLSPIRNLMEMLNMLFKTSNNLARNESLRWYQFACENHWTKFNQNDDFLEKPRRS